MWNGGSNLGQGKRSDRQAERTRKKWDRAIDKLSLGNRQRKSGYAEHDLDRARPQPGMPKTLHYHANGPDYERLGQVQIHNPGKQKDKEDRHRTGNPRQGHLQARSRYRQRQIAEKNVMWNPAVQTVAER